jgi:hypothetical protein
MSRDEFRPRESTAPQEEHSSPEGGNNTPGESDGANAAGSVADPWDANDVRRQKDQFAPPEVACECWCMHCRRVFTSDAIWFQRVINDPQDFPGFWKCPTPNCGGAGFTFDIFPTDPDHPANAGWSYDDGDEDEGDWEGDDAADGPDAEWDPEESKYKALDEVFGEDDDGDLEGEEWKYGLKPGQRPAHDDWEEQAQLEHEAEERRYDEPDERPRVLDWSDREDRAAPPEGWKDDDIPF